MDGLLINGRRRDPPGFEDAVDGLPLDRSRGEGAAGVAAVEERDEVHGYLFLVIQGLSRNLFCHFGQMKCVETPVYSSFSRPK